MEVSWELRCPLEKGGSGAELEWLRELQVLRGRVFYEEGLRPFFQVAENQFLDKDNFDLICYHILAKINNKIVGGIRLLPLSPHRSCVTEEIIGKAPFDELIQACFGDKIIGLSEMSRWFVDPKYHATRIGPYLVYAVWALANHLRLAFIANSGRKTKNFITHYGGAYLSKCPGSYYSEKYNDEIHILFFDKKRLSNKALKHIEEMHKILKLTHNMVNLELV